MFCCDVFKLSRPSVRIDSNTGFIWIGRHYCRYWCYCCVCIFFFLFRRVLFLCCTNILINDKHRYRVICMIWVGMTGAPITKKTTTTQVNWWRHRKCLTDNATRIHNVYISFKEIISLRRPFEVDQKSRRIKTRLTRYSISEHLSLIYPVLSVHNCMVMCLIRDLNKTAPHTISLLASRSDMHISRWYYRVRNTHKHRKKEKKNWPNHTITWAPPR